MKNKTIGNFAFILHAHIPYVLGHGVWPHGTEWLNEAVAESYLPLLQIFYKLIDEGYSPKVTLGITPILSEQLSSESFKTDFLEYLNTKIKIAEGDREQFNKKNEAHFCKLAEKWRDNYKKLLDFYIHKLNKDILQALRKLQDEGHIEIITSCATHGYLPLLGKDNSINLQIKQGVFNYIKLFKRKPKGFWLPECAYRPSYKWKSPVGKIAEVTRKGIENFLSENGIKYFIIDTHLLKGGKSVGVYIHRFQALKKLWRQFEKQYKPSEENLVRNPYEAYFVMCDNINSVAVFTRDPQTGIQVWSGEHGYPGDGWYLEFHKKHFPGGLRYWRITSHKNNLKDKLEYEPEKAKERVIENAGHFKQLVKDILINNYKNSQRAGILCAPYDTELFGHWWSEGVEWIYYVLKWISDDPELKLTTCSSYLEENIPTDIITLPEGSWGQGGFHWIWLNEWTEWTWECIYEAEEKLKSVLLYYTERGSLDKQIRRVLKQALRELLLLQSSDWQFLISTWSAKDYAESRTRKHFDNINRLFELAKKYKECKNFSNEELSYLSECEKQNNIFPDIKLEWYINEDTI